MPEPVRPIRVTASGPARAARLSTHMSWSGFTAAVSRETRCGRISGS